ncbi:hypothetical protein B0H63DRAFT_186168 [Podospora didyma]|uniref:Uncharacterized protein n=1 Tax=Podospora didyma TaxID=330526 RepID=A0AAE0NQ77_9PEZI|nr:hypothetical protein B0H63DRAFT_186168 [Podospora didyma]
MADTNGNNVSEELFHTTLTVVDYHADTSGSTRLVYVLGTHTTLPAAKTFSYKALEGLNYSPDDFAEYASRAQLSEGEAWKYGDGVMVYAKAPAGQEFLVGIDTKPNTENLPSNPETSELALPKGHDHLHYVLQTKTDYNQDKSGAFQTTEIEGCYVRRADAMAAARQVLDDMRDDFSQYDDCGNMEEKGQWPFGDDVVVHAVAQTGENYSVAVRTVPGAHKKHAKKQ